MKDGTRNSASRFSAWRRATTSQRHPSRTTNRERSLNDFARLQGSSRLCDSLGTAPYDLHSTAAGHMPRNPRMETDTMTYLAVGTALNGKPCSTTNCARSTIRDRWRLACYLGSFGGRAGGLGVFADE